MVTRAISEGQTIIYQTPWGDRFEVKARLVGRGNKVKKHFLTSREKRLIKVAKYQYAEYYFL